MNPAIWRVVNIYTGINEGEFSRYVDACECAATLGGRLNRIERMDD